MKELQFLPTLQLYTSQPTPCPYLKGRTWITNFFVARTFPVELYETLLSEKFRRSGTLFYKNTCKRCSSCIPLRIPVQEFRPSPSMKKCLRKNRDVTIEETSIQFDPQVSDLYRRYCNFKHGKEHTSEQEDGFIRFLCTSPIETRMLRYLVRGNLIGASWIDILPRSFSSVYFAFDPAEARRSLGTYSVLKEIELAKQAGKLYYHLGFYVPGSPKMEYKARFKPHELLVSGVWQRGNGNIRAMEI
ncbi:MAG: arginyltransferase [Spirochaetales bacterium]